MDRAEVLRALGPGGTAELADLVLSIVASAGGSPAVQRYGGLAEVCTELSASRQTVGHWIAGRRGPGGFPEPEFVLAATPVWNLDSVAEWIVRPSVEGR